VACGAVLDVGVCPFETSDDAREDRTHYEGQSIHLIVVRTYLREAVSHPNRERGEVEDLFVRRQVLEVRDDIIEPSTCGLENVGIRWG
jgi:hypothetical protein